jgi:tight adherence protein B
MRGPPPLAAVASVTHRLAVLLAAGVAPASAWGYVAEGTPGPVPAAVVAGDPARVVESILGAARARPALEAGAWRGLAAAWTVATVSGAPLAPSLRQYAASLRALAQVQRDVAVALAAPVSTARIVLALPAVGLLFGLGMGFNTLAVLFTTPIGLACLGLGALLIVAALAWNRRLVGAAQPRDARTGPTARDARARALRSRGGALRSRRRARTVPPRGSARGRTAPQRGGRAPTCRAGRRPGESRRAVGATCFHSGCASCPRSCCWACCRCS